MSIGFSENMTLHASSLNWQPTWGEVFRRPLQQFSWLDRGLIRFLLLLLGPLVRVECPTRLSRRGPTIYAFTHSTVFETLFAALLLFFQRQERVGFMVDWMYGHLPFIGSLVAKADPIFVWNKKARFRWVEKLRSRLPQQAAWEVAQIRLAQGQSVAIFPEGKAHSDPEKLRRGKRGLGHIALASNACIVPIGIDFPCRLRRGKMPIFGRIIFRVGEAISCGPAGQDYQRNEDPKQRALLAESLTHKVMHELARLSGRHYPYEKNI